MKAERRHELQTNSLAQFISDLPLYLRFHANKVLFGIIIVCLVILLINYRSRTARAARENSRLSLLAAREGIEQLRFVDRIQPEDSARAMERKQLAAQVSTALDSVLAATSDPQDSTLRAQALIARGDLNWELANLPALQGATTQPSLAMPQTRSSYLDAAEDAYRQALRDYPQQNMAKVNALLGLAAIEENRGNWDKAIEHYNNITRDDAIAAVFKSVARQRLEMIPQIRNPVFMGIFSSTQPTTQAATAPSTQPAPATQP